MDCATLAGRAHPGRPGVSSWWHPPTVNLLSFLRDSAYTKLRVHYMLRVYTKLRVHTKLRVYTKLRVHLVSRVRPGAPGPGLGEIKLTPGPREVPCPGARQEESVPSISAAAHRRHEQLPIMAVDTATGACAGACASAGGGGGGPDEPGHGSGHDFSQGC